MFSVVALNRDVDHNQRPLIVSNDVYEKAFVSGDEVIAHAFAKAKSRGDLQGEKSETALGAVSSQSAPDAHIRPRQGFFPFFYCGEKGGCAFHPRSS